MAPGPRRSWALVTPAARGPLRIPAHGHPHATWSVLADSYRHFPESDPCFRSRRCASVGGTLVGDLVVPER